MTVGVGQPGWVFGAPAPNAVSKFPEEIRVFQFDFTNTPELRSGATIASQVVSVSPADGNLTVNQTPVFTSGGVIGFDFTGGASGTNYLVTCDVTLSEGSKLTCLGLILVLDPNQYKP